MATNKNQLKLILGLIIVLYLLFASGVYFFTESYINEKSAKMYSHSYERLNSYFKFDRKYVDIAYSNYRVSYKQIPLPKPREITAWEAQHSANYLAKGKGGLDIDAMEESSKELNAIEQKKWQQEYGDVGLLYVLDAVPEENYGSGWSIRIITKKPEQSAQPGFMIYYLYPKMFAYKSTDYLWYGERPSIEDALQEALDFELKNDKSELSEFYSKGSTRGLVETICSDVNNEYWFITKDSARTTWWNDPNDINYFGSFSANEKPVPAGSMFNGYYKVYFERSQPTTYSLNRVSQEIIDKNILYMRIILWLVLTLIFAVPIAIMSTKIHKKVVIVPSKKQ